jgi:hypothetical protein
MVKKSKKQKPDMVFDKDGKILSTQPNQITDLHIVPSLYTERAMDELVWALQPFYAAAKRKENQRKEAVQLMIPFNKDDAYLVTPELANTIQHEGDFIATIRFRDLPGITPRHYGELRQVLNSMKKIDAEVHTKDGVLYTNFIDIIAEYDSDNTATWNWLRDNCWRYGFILRYPKGKEEITGIDYEPWHFRYVGVPTAQEITESGLCLEEYLAQP